VSPDGRNPVIRRVWVFETGKETAPVRHGVPDIEKEIIMREKDLVVWTRDVLDRGLRAGDIGTIVVVHREGAGYEVEFSTLAGRTLAVVTVRAGDVRPVVATLPFF
jgi:uncharacterized protein DUF4926